ncbi:MAG: hypothetical protein IH987_01510 [Planctomycetes bacterium]|nr:hypothetical protein [Planctomycetota bacterium]
MNALKLSFVSLLAVLFACQAVVLAGAPVGTTLTYQGQLKEAGAPLNGNVDLLFELFDAEVDGSSIGSPLLLENVPVVKGLFSVDLDFGAAVFIGEARWMQIQVRSPNDPGDTEPFTPLSPRPPLTGTPYALFSLAPWHQNGNDVSYTRGNVGIGTTDPQKALHLDLPSNANEGILLAKAGTSLGTMLGVSGSNNQQFCIDIDPNNVSGFEQFQVRYNGVTTVFVIDDDGRVGIGTNSPESPLTVAGPNNVGPGSASIEVQNTTEGTGRRWIVGSSEEGLFQVADLTAGGNTRLVIDPIGEVGIGTTAPRATLHVVRDTSHAAILAENTSTSDNTRIGVRGITTASSGRDFGVFGLSHSTSGQGVAGLAIANSGVTDGVHGCTNSPDGFGVFSFGDFGGTGAKFFIQPHPYDPSKEIRFVCLEGNESGTYFRGSARLINGRAVIDVPEEFRLVSEFDGLTVQATAMGANAGLWVESKDLDRIVVVGNGNVDFDYFVNGVRRGFADIQLTRENHSYVPVVRGVPYANQYRPAHRRIMVENGILNADFTPNEETCARMGWTLREPTSEELARYEVTRKADGGTEK